MNSTIFFAAASLVGAMSPHAVWRQDKLAPVSRAASLAFAAAVGMSTPLDPVQAQTYVAPGAMIIDGYSVACGSAPTYLMGSELGDVARGGPAGIFLNWPLFNTLTTTEKAFIYAHECGHVLYGSNENVADEFAIRLGRNQGWIRPWTLQQICASVYLSPGDWTHLPGPLRCQAMTLYYSRF